MAYVWRCGACKEVNRQVWHRCRGCNRNDTKKQFFWGEEPKVDKKKQIDAEGFETKGKGKGKRGGPKEAGGKPGLKNTNSDEPAADQTEVADQPAGAGSADEAERDPSRMALEEDVAFAEALITFWTSGPGGKREEAKSMLASARVKLAAAKAELAKSLPPTVQLQRCERRLERAVANLNEAQGEAGRHRGQDRGSQEVARGVQGHGRGEGGTPSRG